MDAWFDTLERLAGEHTWIVKIFLVVLLTLIVSLGQRIVLARISRKAHETRNVWDDSFIDALTGPVRGAIWIIGIGFAAQIAGAHSDSPLFNHVGVAQRVGIIVMLSWFALRLVALVADRYYQTQIAAGENVDETAIDAVAKLLRASIAITATLVVLQTLGFSVSGVLAFGGIGGIAVGFAAKDVLSNLFGGLTVYLDRPFSVGDWIRSPDREIEGVVERIGWRSTLIRTFDKRALYVPNQVFASISVENPSRMTNRRINETIGVRYGDIDCLPAILTDIREMLKNHEAIDTDQTLMVNLVEFGESSVNFFIYTFTRTTVWTEFHAIKDDVMLTISEIITGHGASIAYPTQVLHIPDEVAVASR